MIHPKDWIAKIQAKPYETRIKILWISVLVIAVLLVIFWAFGLKSTFGNLSNTSQPGTSPIQTPAQALAPANFTTVERVEQTSDQLIIYFNFNNQTNDILNVSKLADITLVADKQSLSPTSLVDRQNKPFVIKTLSHTQNFGTLTFPGTNAKTGTLTFANMFLDRTPDQIFMQKLELNFDTLNKKTDVRN